MTDRDLLRLLDIACRDQFNKSAVELLAEYESNEEFQAAKRYAEAILPVTLVRN